MKYFSFHILALSLSMVYFAVTRKSAQLMAAVSALIWIIMHFDTIWSKRATVQGRVRRVPDDQILRVLKPINPGRLWKQRSMLARMELP